MTNDEIPAIDTAHDKLKALVVGIPWIHGTSIARNYRGESELNVHLHGYDPTFESARNDFAGQIDGFEVFFRVVTENVYKTKKSTK